MLGNGLVFPAGPLREDLKELKTLISLLLMEQKK